jgi:hypothetical protein
LLNFKGFTMRQPLKFIAQMGHTVWVIFEQLRLISRRNFIAGRTRREFENLPGISRPRLGFFLEAASWLCSRVTLASGRAGAVRSRAKGTEEPIETDQHEEIIYPTNNGKDVGDEIYRA